MDDATRRQLLAEVEADIGKLSRELEELHRLRTYLSRQLGVPAPPLPSAYLPPQANGTVHPASPRWYQLAARVLRQAGADRPMRAKEIADELVARHGVKPRGERGLERKVYTVMSRRKDTFKNLGDGLWTLKEFMSGPPGEEPDAMPPREDQGPMEADPQE